MAISQIRVGGTLHDVKDAEARAQATQNASDVSDLKSAIGDIHNPAGNAVEKSKNLLAINPAFIGATIRGVTIGWSEDGESITLHGGPSDGNTAIPVTGDPVMSKTFPTGTYTFTLSDLVGINSTSKLYVRYSTAVGGASTTIVYHGNLSNTVEFTEPVSVYIQIQNGVSYNNASFKLQIEAGSTATAYAKPAGIADYTLRKTVSGLSDSVTAAQTDIDDLQDDVSELQANTPMTSEMKANSASFDVPFERYENIQYVDTLTNYSSIAALDSSTITVDHKIRFRNMPFSVKCTTSTGGSSYRFRIVLGTALPIMGLQEVELYVYTEDAANIGTSAHVLELYGVTTKFKKYYNTPLQNGWTKIRFAAEGAAISGSDFDKSETEWRLYVFSNSETPVTVWIGGIYAVKPDKANLILVDDGPYLSYYNNAYPSLKAIGAPVTWAGDWSFVGDGIHTNVITDTELAVLKADGLSEFSFHNFDGTLQNVEPSTSGGPYNPNATKFTALADTVNSIRYLRENGLEPNHLWRAAWQGNNCTYPELANEEVEASATPDKTYGVAQFPWPNRFNLPRYAMQGSDRDSAFITTLFAKMEHQHCTVFLYTHGVSDDRDDDLPPALFQEYLTAITAGINAGWLNVTTYSRLVEHYRRIV